MRPAQFCNLLPSDFNQNHPGPLCNNNIYLTTFSVLASHKGLALAGLVTLQNHGCLDLPREQSRHCTYTMVHSRVTEYAEWLEGQVQATFTICFWWD
jgi:hypothetical protein